ncbi:MAG: DsbA family protein, partial [bacterium]
YIPDNKNYEEFSRKHPVNQEILNQNDKIEKMNKWCREMEIRYTPTIFINGYQLPDAYAIEDLKYFLLE